MGQEIERKFLVASSSWQAHADAGALIRQGYLSTDPACTVRVRRMGDESFITVKGKASGLVRAEFEYAIPLADAEAMLGMLCRGPLLEKRRYLVRHEGQVWEIDEFLGANAGLIVAELEMDTADEVFSRPSWLGLEVSDDPRYLNSRLSERPFGTWPKS